MLAQQKSFWVSMAIYIVFIILTPITIHAAKLGNPYSYTNESNLISMSVYAENLGAQGSAAVKITPPKSKTDIGFRLDLDLGFPIFFGGNQSIKKLWKSAVPLSEYDSFKY